MPIVVRNNRLKMLLTERSITATELARAIGVSKAQASYFSTGAKNVPFDFIPKIAELLKVPRKQLLEELNVVKHRVAT